MLLGEWVFVWNMEVMAFESRVENKIIVRLIP